jgi:hypothetical protein
MYIIVRRNSKREVIGASKNMGTPGPFGSGTGLGPAETCSLGTTFGTSPGSSPGSGPGPGPDPVVGVGGVVDVIK